MCATDDQKQQNGRMDGRVVAILFAAAILVIVFVGCAGYKWYTRIVVEVEPSDTLVLIPAKSTTIVLRNKSRISVSFKLYGLPPTLRTSLPVGEIAPMASTELKIWYNASSALGPNSRVSMVFGKKRSDETPNDFFERTKDSETEQSKMTKVIVAVELRSRKMVQQ